MGRYNFVSEGGAAADALEQLLMRRAMAERQRMLDERAGVEQAATIRQRDEQIAAQRAQAEESAAIRRQSAADLGEEREFRRATTFAQTGAPGVIDPDMHALLDRQGYGGLVKQGQPTQGAQIGEAEEGVPLYDVAPGLMEFSGGSNWQAARAAEEARAAQATQAQQATAERAAADRASREAMAGETNATREMIAGLAASNRQTEPLEAVIGEDGRSVLLPRSQAVGRRPASAREQGRPVMSSDANRIAELDTSLNDIDVLERDLGSTGAQSAIGAALPNVVTEFTGIGADAKARQAVIDRVKQVIGKALEGGVLRKEDELKYAKILPTIGDDPSVSKSKLAGLRQALTQRRQTLIEALSDAGYDASNFTGRSGRPRITSIRQVP